MNTGISEYLLIFPREYFDWMSRTELLPTSSGVQISFKSLKKRMIKVDTPSTLTSKNNGVLRKKSF